MNYISNDTTEKLLDLYKKIEDFLMYLDDNIIKEED